MNIELYNLFYTGFTEAFGTITLIMTFLPALNYFYWAGIIRMKTVPSFILAVLPIMAAILISGMNASWGIGVLIIIEAFYVVSSLILLFR